MPTQRSTNEQSTAPKLAGPADAAAMPTMKKAAPDCVTVEHQPEALTTDILEKVPPVPDTDGFAADQLPQLDPCGNPSEPPVGGAPALPVLDTGPVAAVAASFPQHSAQQRERHSQQHAEHLQPSPDVECLSLGAVLPMLPPDSCADSPAASAEAPARIGGATAATTGMDVGRPRRQSAQVSCYPNTDAIYTGMLMLVFCCASWRC